MRIVATLPFEILKTIYELMYKLGWLTAEERDQGNNLPDRSYLEKQKVENDLKKYLPIGLEELITTYRKWIDTHEMDKNFMDFVQKLTHEDIFSAALPKLIRAHVYGLSEETVVDAVIKAIAPIIRPEAILEKFAPAYLEAVFPNEANYSSHTNEELLERLYISDDLFSQWANEINSQADAIADELSKRYMENNDIYGTIVVPKNDTLARLEAAREAPLTEQIEIFHNALSEIHHSGVMADHLLGMPGEGKRILDELSFGVYTEPWAKDMTQVFGHPPGESLFPQKTTGHLQAALRMLAQEDPASVVDMIDKVLYDIGDYIPEITVVGNEITIYYDGEYQTFRGENDPKLETWLQQRDLLGVIDQKDPEVDIYYGHFEPVTHWERRI